MNKSILLLINGFGIEQSDSYNIYDSILMPNLDRLTKDCLFASIKNKYLNYFSGYRNFSIGIDEALTYSLIDNNISNKEYEKNEVLKAIMSDALALKSKVHIICYYENNTTIEHLFTYVRQMLLTPDVKIFIHLVLCQDSLNDYKNMANTLTMINYDLGQRVSIGVISGHNNFNNLLVFKDYIKTMVSEAGEKWKDMNKKVEVLLHSNTIPSNARTFCVTPGFRITNNDQILFFNYNKEDVSKFNKEFGIQKYVKLDLNTIKYYSLFPTINDQNIPYMYNYAVSSTYAVNSLKSINAKCLLLDKKDNINEINYLFMGLRNESDALLTFMQTDNGFLYNETQILNIIKKYPQELIIINYELDSCKTIEEIKERLSKIDLIISSLDKLVQSGITLFISSLYGIEKELYNAKHELCKVNFSQRVPLVIDSTKYPKAQYAINDGTLHDLSNSIYKSINNSYKVSGILGKKSSFFSFLYKKPKEVK